MLSNVKIFSHIVASIEGDFDFTRTKLMFDDLFSIFDRYDSSLRRDL